MQENLPGKTEFPDMHRVNTLRHRQRSIATESIKSVLGAGYQQRYIVIIG